MAPRTPQLADLADSIPPIQRRSCSSASDLAASETRLLHLMQRVGFGRIENVRISEGEPRLSEGLRVIRDIKLGVRDALPQPPTGDFALKQEVRDFFGILRELESSIVRKIEIRHGLPVHLQIEDLAGASGDGQ